MGDDNEIDTDPHVGGRVSKQAYCMPRAPSRNTSTKVFRLLSRNEPAGPASAHPLPCSWCSGRPCTQYERRAAPRPRPMRHASPTPLASRRTHTRLFAAHARARAAAAAAAHCAFASAARTSSPNKS